MAKSEDDDCLDPIYEALGIVPEYKKQREHGQRAADARVASLRILPDAGEAPRVLPRDAMPDRDWSTATPAVREAELLSLAQSTMRNALQLGLFENPRTKAQVNHNLQVLTVSTGLLRRHAPRPVQRDPTFAAEDALRGQAEQALAAIVTGRLSGDKAVAAAEQGEASDLRANKFQQSRIARSGAAAGVRGENPSCPKRYNPR
jgi:hypothetical protein